MKEKVNKPTIREHNRINPDDSYVNKSIPPAIAAKLSIIEKAITLKYTEPIFPNSIETDTLHP